MSRSKKHAVGPKQTIPLEMPTYTPDRKRRVPTTANGKIHHQIVNAICALAMEAGIYDASKVPIIAVRVKDWLEATADAAQVELVLTEITRDRCAHLDFEPLRDFTPGTWEHFKRLLDIPDGAWAYALWRDAVEDEKLRRSIDYWLGVWKDQVDTSTPEQTAIDPVVINAQQMLETLRTSAALETVAWL